MRLTLALYTLYKRIAFGPLCEQYAVVRDVWTDFHNLGINMFLISKLRVYFEILQCICATQRNDSSIGLGRSRLV